jgi:hypothetical protein
VTTPGNYNSSANSAGSAPNPLTFQISTPMTGFPLVNGTPNIISWTAPNDGKMHRFLVWGGETVSSAQTGGEINVTFTAPDGSVQNITMLGPSLSTGFSLIDAVYQMMSLILPGTTVSINQATAQTAGAAKLYAEIWGC